MTIQAEASCIKNWKRLLKFSPTSEQGKLFAPDGKFNLAYQFTISAQYLVAIRMFALRPDEYDDQYGILVLEDKDGKLHLGEHL